MAKNTKYVSEIDEFISSLHKTKPQLAEQQNQLRQTWWDKESYEVKSESKLFDSNLKNKGYAYFDYSNCDN